MLRGATVITMKGPAGSEECEERRYRGGEQPHQERGREGKRAGGRQGD